MTSEPQRFLNGPERYATRDRQVAQRAREVLGVVVDAPRPFESYANQFDVWLDETPQWLNAATSRILSEPRPVNPVPEPVTVEPQAFVKKPVESVNVPSIDGTFSLIYGFCGGSTAHSTTLNHSASLTKETAVQALASWMERRPPCTTIVTFPDREGGRLDTLFSHIPVGTDITFVHNCWKYVYRRVPSLPVVTSWNSGAKVVNHVLMGLLKEETEESFQKRKAEADPRYGPVAKATTYNNEGMI